MPPFKVGWKKNYDFYEFLARSSAVQTSNKPMKIKFFPWFCRVYTDSFMGCFNMFVINVQS